MKHWIVSVALPVVFLLWLVIHLSIIDRFHLFFDSDDVITFLMVLAVIFGSGSIGISKFILNINGLSKAVETFGVGIVVSAVFVIHSLIGLSCFMLCTHVLSLDRMISFGISIIILLSDIATIRNVLGFFTDLGRFKK